MKGDMKNSNLKERLTKIMKMKNLKQVELVKLIQPLCEKNNVKIGKSDINQYLTGAIREPSIEKIKIIAEALDTNELWLQGYDVPNIPDLRDFVADEDYDLPLDFPEIGLKKGDYMNGFDMVQLLYARMIYQEKMEALVERANFLTSKFKDESITLKEMKELESIYKEKRKEARNDYIHLVRPIKIKYEDRHIIKNNKKDNISKNEKEE